MCLSAGIKTVVNLLNFIVLTKSHCIITVMHMFIRVLRIICIFKEAIDGVTSMFATIIACGSEARLFLGLAVSTTS